MRTFKLFWNTHKWTGIVLALILATTAVTGFLLLLKKEFAWIQPPTQRGTEGDYREFASIGEVIDAVLAQGHEDFTSVDDVDRIDFRPGKSIHKVRSVRNDTEFQVDAMTGEVVSGPDVRRSDLIERIHDGSFIADWFHDYIMPLSAIGLLFLTFSGIWLWLEPKWRRRKRNRAAARS